MRSLVRGTLIAVLALTALIAASPSHAHKPSDRVNSMQHCAALIAKNALDRSGRTEVARHCSVNPQTAVEEIGAQGGTLLLTIWADVGYGGYSISFYGDAGPCDGAGYRINLGGIGWANRTSSMRSYNYCSGIRAYDGPDLTGVYWWYSGLSTLGHDVPWVGTGANDRFDSIRVLHF